MLSTPVPLWRTKWNTTIRKGDNRRYNGRTNLNEKTAEKYTEDLAQDQERAAVAQRKLRIKDRESESVVGIGLRVER